MTTTESGLPPALIFEPDGHVSDLCVTCVTDGELSLVPQAALDHLDACDPCGARLGEAALLSVAAGEALRGAARVAARAVASPALVPVAALPEIASEIPPGPCAPVSPRRLRRPLPLAAITAALFVAAITAGPALVDATAGLPALLAAAVGWVPTILRLARTLVVSGPSALGPWALALKGVSAAVFVLAGLQVARAATRRAVAVEGGGR